MKPDIQTSTAENKLKKYTIVGLIISGIIAILLAYFIPSVVEIWYPIGSIFIPGIILPVVSAYFPRLRVSNKIISLEMIVAFIFSTSCYFIKSEIALISILNNIELMLVGFVFTIIIHLIGLIIRQEERLS